VCLLVLRLVTSTTDFEDLKKTVRAPAACLYKVCQLAPQVLLPLACPLAPFPLPVGHDDEDVAAPDAVASAEFHPLAPY
jgi:hypothetical protein